MTQKKIQNDTAYDDEVHFKVLFKIYVIELFILGIKFILIKIYLLLILQSYSLNIKCPKLESDNTSLYKH